MAVAPPQQSSEAEAVQDQRGLLDKIEDFCSMPDFTDSISDFAAQHSQEFATGPIEGEHPVRHAAYRRTAHCRHDSCQCTSRQLRWHELYLQYTALIEGKLEAFLKEQGVPVAAMLSAAQSDDSGAYTCIDYLVASTEYDSFLQLMHDFCAMSAWDAGADEGTLGALEEERVDGGDEPDAAAE